MPTTAQALDTYKRSIANETEDEHMPWVKEVTNCLRNNTNPSPHIWMPFVYDVVIALRNEMNGTISMADEKDRP